MKYSARELQGKPNYYAVFKSKDKYWLSTVTTDKTEAEQLAKLKSIEWYRIVTDIVFISF